MQCLNTYKDGDEMPNIKRFDFINAFEDDIYNQEAPKAG